MDAAIARVFGAREAEWVRAELALRRVINAEIGDYTRAKQIAGAAIVRVRRSIERKVT